VRDEEDEPHAVGMAMIGSLARCMHMHNCVSVCTCCCCRLFAITPRSLARLLACSLATLQVHLAGSASWKGQQPNYESGTRTYRVSNKWIRVFVDVHAAGCSIGLCVYEQYRYTRESVVCANIMLLRAGSMMDGFLVPIDETSQEGRGSGGTLCVYPKPFLQFDWLMFATLCCLIDR
jgi:hypothetical protein